MVSRHRIDRIGGRTAAGISQRRDFEADWTAHHERRRNAGARPSLARDDGRALSSPRIALGQLPPLALAVEWSVTLAMAGSCFSWAHATSPKRWHWGSSSSSDACSACIPKPCRTSISVGRSERPSCLSGRSSSGQGIALENRFPVEGPAPRRSFTDRTGVAAVQCSYEPYALRSHMDAREPRVPPAAIWQLAPGEECDDGNSAPGDFLVPTWQARVSVGVVPAVSGQAGRRLVPNPALPFGHVTDGAGHRFEPKCKSRKRPEHSLHYHEIPTGRSESVCVRRRRDPPDSWHVEQLKTGVDCFTYRSGDRSTETRRRRSLCPNVLKR